MSLSLLKVGKCWRREGGQRERHQQTVQCAATAWQHLYLLPGRAAALLLCSVQLLDRGCAAACGAACMAEGCRPRCWLRPAAHSDACCGCCTAAASSLLMLPPHLVKLPGLHRAILVDGARQAEADLLADLV